METVKSIFNEDLKRFEVWKEYEETGVKALLLALTMDEVCELLREQAVNMLTAIGA